ncbi:hypothetical protein AJ85_10830 [Alkalihalobacillus alcalophilus ATCC 27647 = CGMCC 1.3604]|uniref:FAD linked oxidase N-terminal domain-containing protein n=1 Tax=Alkalihalobacillus alcalophilus ATCC 27647 = CGMCC 1.3604 TaxID=1218173 RepID=A0A4S4JYV9_ALKAL|nr:FAD-binding protein [Alkalihalobacillus alcalophilus]MED1563375.1 FAD-binding protein [Alkalihalobacillus alcalophilus]THG90411.1 hypothetical protein AJ85_10830 [Alkalihalobacillus alcalophilus ATCC 27647 = CGMCC 1.3604]
MGIKLGNLENELASYGYSLRFFPSTYIKSTRGGFIAGGTGGIGSIEYGTLWDEGNVIELSILTMEEKPHRLTVKGEELKKYIHNYGVSGIIVEAVIALAPLRKWSNQLICFEKLEDALTFSEEIATNAALTKRLVSVSEAPLATSFKAFSSYISESTTTVLLLIQEGNEAEIADIAHGYNGTYIKKFDAEMLEKKARITDFSWNHVTLWWMKKDPSATYLQGRFNRESYLEQVKVLKEKYPSEIWIHFEWIKVQGQVVPSSQPIIQFRSEDRLNEIITEFREVGIKVSNPHTYLLEEGGKDDWIQDICLAKKENDPYHLLNPGKLKAGLKQEV